MCTDEHNVDDASERDDTCGGKPLANVVLMTPVWGSMRVMLPSTPSVTYNAPSGPMVLPDAPCRPFASRETCGGWSTSSAALPDNWCATREKPTRGGCYAHSTKSRVFMIVPLGEGFDAVFCRPFAPIGVNGIQNLASMDTQALGIHWRPDFDGSACDRVAARLGRRRPDGARTADTTGPCGAASDCRALHGPRARRAHTPADGARQRGLRTVDVERVRWQNRAHFLAVAARLMRRILVDFARSRRYRKRGGEVEHVAFDETVVIDIGRGHDMLALDDALDELARVDARQCQIVVMRFFAGLRVEEIANVIDVSPATVMRDWKLAKSWLLRELDRTNQGSET